MSVSAMLPRAPAAAAIARQIVTRRFSAFLPRHALDDLRLVVSELATNAVLYGDGAIELQLSYEGGRVRGAVTDEGAGFTYRQRSEPGAIGGNGLRLVACLAERWGMREQAATVWFELPMARDLI